MLTAANVHEHTVSCFTHEGVHHAKPLPFFLERYAQAYQLELHAFVAALSGENVALPSMYDGMQALCLAEAAMLAVQQGQTITVDAASL